MESQNEKQKVKTDKSSLSHNSKFTSKESPTQVEAEILENNDIQDRSFLERWKNSRFWLVRGSYIFLVSVWTVVMVIGGFIVWLISFLFI